MRSYYNVDPALLPAAGASTTRPPKFSASLLARQEKLTEWHLQNVEHRRNTLLGLTASTIYDRRPRDVGQTQPLSARTPRQLAADMAVTLDLRPPKEGATLKSTLLPAAFRHTVNRFDPRLKHRGAFKGSAAVNLLVERIRKRLQSMGTTMGAQLEKMFVEADTDGSGALSFEEFKECMFALDMLADENECALVHHYFDVDGSGELDIHEFKQATLGQMNDVRRAVVQEAFRALDADGDGYLTIHDLKAKCLTQHHPQVVSGEKTEEEIAQELLGFMDTLNSDGAVTQTEFERYYEYTSALIADDELFVTTVRNAWGLEGATGGHCLKVRINQRTMKGGLRSMKQRVVEIRPVNDLNRYDPEFHLNVMKRLAALGYKDVVNFDVLGRY